MSMNFYLTTVNPLSSFSFTPCQFDTSKVIQIPTPKNPTS